MFGAVLSAVALVFLSSVGLVSCVLPDFIKPCQSNDPELSKCIMKAIDQLKPRLVSGIPELDVPPLEPLELQTLYLQGINCNVTDLKVSGSSRFEIVDLRANVPKNRFAFIVKLPKLSVAGRYQIDARILVLNLKGKGPIRGNFSDYGFTGILKGKRVQQNGEEYLKFDKMKLDIHMGRTQLKLENLFNGNPTLSSITNDVLNDSNDSIIKEILPVLEQSLSDHFTNVANKITLRFTHKELFL